MTDYNDYVQAINKIYEYLNIIKSKWNDQDNLNHIESIEEYKDLVVKMAELFKTPAPNPSTTDKNDKMEALGQ